MAARMPLFQPVYRTSEVRAVEAQAFALPDPPPLMARAGRAAAERARALAADHTGPVLVLAGPGNNGGDALVLARHLGAWWFDVVVVFTGDRKKLSADAGAAFDDWQAAGGTVTAEIPVRSDWRLAVDGLFGIGLQRDLDERHAQLVAAFNALPCPRLALDIPSGLEADSGRVLGTAVRADHTVTFIALKPGLLTLDGPDHCGTIEVADLGLDVGRMSAPHGRLLDEAALAHCSAPRARNTHKGHYGSLGVIGGASGMLGAALLAGRAALMAGTGRVYVGLLAENAPPVDFVQPELMLRPAADVPALDQLTALAVGPGLGQSANAHRILATAIESPLPLVLDADALNLLAADAALGRRLAQRKGSTLLTPHPAEAARLLATDSAGVQRDRVAAACALARQFDAHVVLKGCGSVCAGPDGRWWINPSGNPGMASAGMGDVLTGLVGALLARGVAADAALTGAVWLHGAAADRAVADGHGPAGLTATETIAAARHLLNAS
jgi:hydroxyethylthiazole kinase-like uncharacterized protein yjeF